jgi:hypothetical protein
MFSKLQLTSKKNNFFFEVKTLNDHHYGPYTKCIRYLLFASPTYKNTLTIFFIKYSPYVSVH